MNRGSQHGVRWPVSLEGVVRNQPVGRAFGRYLLRRLAEGQRLGLRKDVGDQLVVVMTERVQALAKGDEVARDEARALMDQLIERMLAIGAGSPQ